MIRSTHVQSCIFISGMSPDTVTWTTGRLQRSNDLYWGGKCKLGNITKHWSLNLSGEIPVIVFLSYGYNDYITRSIFSITWLPCHWTLLFGRVYSTFRMKWFTRQRTKFGRFHSTVISSWMWRFDFQVILNRYYTTYMVIYTKIY